MLKKLLFFLFIQVFLLESYAATITVTNSADNVVGGLRYAVANAASGDTIVFAPSLVGGIISIAPEVIVLDKDLFIIGPGKDKLTITNYRTNSILFYVEDAIDVFISGVKIQGCGDDEVPMQNGLSGAIYNKGSLTIEDVLFYTNFIGAIYSTGVLNLNRVLFEENYTKGNNYPGRSGGVTSTGVATIKYCRFDWNGSDGGPGNTGSILNSGTMVVENTSVLNGWSQAKEYNIVAAISNTGTLQLINCTISKCYTSGKGYPGAGGIYNSGNLQVEYCTIAYNIMDNTNYPDVPFSHPDYFRSFKGSGIYNEGQLSLHGSIIAQNGSEEFYYSYRTAPVEEGADGFSINPVNDLGYNFIGVNEGLNLNASTNLLGTSVSYLNPLLGPLKDNGGFAPTYALLEDSPCIDAGGTSNNVFIDQRGVQRSKPDIGAYEYVYEPELKRTDVEIADWNDLKLVPIFNHSNTRLEVTQVPGYRKLKLGYDNIGIYHANKNVIAGGNNTLEIWISSYTTVDWSKIEIRPNGSTVNPVVLSDYLNRFGYMPWPLKIPLSDFDPSIDFSQLIVLEFPYSTNAGYFKLNIHKIAFVGGAEPFLWFGEEKFDNKFDGGGVGGQLKAKLYERTSLDQITKVEFFSNSIKIGESVNPPFNFNWDNVESGEYSLVSVAHTVSGNRLVAPPKVVVIGSRVYREASESAQDELQIYPNPLVDILTIKSSNSNALVVISDINGVIQYQNAYSNFQNGQADISFLPAGLYFLKLEDDENPSGKVFKLIKQ